jgi:Ca2+-binding EF-hand superfamily protein
MNRLTHEQIQDLKDVFAMFDYDHNGTIDGRELMTAMRAIGQDPTEEEVAELISSVDGNHTGSLEFHEFLGIMANSMIDEDLEHQLRGAFACFSGADDYITPHELIAGLKRYGHKEITLDEAEQILLYSKHDGDADGKISFDEFIEFMAVDDQHKSGAAKVHPEVPSVPKK